MKIAKKFSILLGLLCLSLSAYAHQPDLSSTILAEKGDNEWVLQIRASLTAFEYEVEARYGESAYATPEEFRELVIEHLQEEIILRFNDGTVTTLKDGVVKLGHETTATFQLTGLPKEVTSVMVRNAAFSNISHNQSALYLVKEGFDRKQFVLNDDNGHSATLEVNGTHFVLAKSGEKAGYLLPMLLLAIVGLAGGLAYLTWSRKQSFKSAMTEAGR